MEWAHKSGGDQHIHGHMATGEGSCRCQAKLGRTPHKSAYFGPRRNPGKPQWKAPQVLPNSAQVRRIFRNPVEPGRKQTRSGRHRPIRDVAQVSTRFDRSGPVCGATLVIAATLERPTVAEIMDLPEICPLLGGPRKCLRGAHQVPNSFPKFGELRPMFAMCWPCSGCWPTLDQIRPKVPYLGQLWSNFGLCYAIWVKLGNTLQTSTKSGRT